MQCPEGERLSLLSHQSGRDEMPGHDAADDNLPRQSGRDDGAMHDATDDKNLNKHGGL